jgi:hypothetical protein
MKKGSYLSCMVWSRHGHECPSSPGTCLLFTEPCVCKCSPQNLVWWAPGSTLKGLSQAPLFIPQIWSQCTFGIHMMMGRIHYTSYCRSENRTMLLIFITLTFLLTWFQNPLSHGLWSVQPTRQIGPFNRPKGRVGETISGHESPTVNAALTCHPPPPPSPAWICGRKWGGHEG